MHGAAPLKGASFVSTCSLRGSGYIDVGLILSFPVPTPGNHGIDSLSAFPPFCMCQAKCDPYLSYILIPRRVQINAQKVAIAEEVIKSVISYE